MIRKIGLMLVLMTVAGVASASDTNSSNCRFAIGPFCIIPAPPSRQPSSPVSAPEIDPASAMAGLTMLAGGMAVLRGRRRIKIKEQ